MPGGGESVWGSVSAIGMLKPSSSWPQGERGLASLRGGTEAQLRNQWAGTRMSNGLRQCGLGWGRRLGASLPSVS